MKTGNGEYVFDFVIDVFEDKRAAVVFHFLEKAEEDAKAGTADISESAAVDYIFVP